MTFLEGLKRANRSSLKVMGQPVIINGVEMTAAIDETSLTTFARPGGRTDDVDMTFFVGTEDFVASGAKKGSTVIFPPTNYKAYVDKIVPFQGVIYVTVGAFRP